MKAVESHIEWFSTKVCIFSKRSMTFDDHFIILYINLLSNRIVHIHKHDPQFQEGKWEELGGAIDFSDRLLDLHFIYLAAGNLSLEFLRSWKFVTIIWKKLFTCKIYESRYMKKISYFRHRQIWVTCNLETQPRNCFCCFYFYQILCRYLRNQPIRTVISLLLQVQVNLKCSM